VHEEVAARADVSTGVLPDEARALEYLLGFDFYARPGLTDYARRHVRRVLRTLAYLPPASEGRELLELGASPYLMSLLAMKHLGFTVTPANFFGDYDEEPPPGDELAMHSASANERHVFRYRMFNLERAPFPYDSGSFDVVLCCEILEHLPCDPSHMLSEIHRVLRPDGKLVLTTPNAKRLENVVLMLRGHNVWPRYSAHGVYGRHNREYTRWELLELLRAHHFDARVDTENAYPHGALYRLASSVGPLLRRRDNLFAVATKHGETVRSYPGWLYEHLDEVGAPGS
jgi:2-polyprenyl-3-methyl-5-hydroxy-6-metoxy-1,4-benzoquinol methylase